MYEKDCIIVGCMSKYSNTMYYIFLNSFYISPSYVNNEHVIEFIQKPVFLKGLCKH